MLSMRPRIVGCGTIRFKIYNFQRHFDGHKKKGIN